MIYVFSYTLNAYIYIMYTNFSHLSSVFFCFINYFVIMTKFVDSTLRTKTKAVFLR